MSRRLEIELDDQGRLVFPVSVVRQLGLTPGTTLVVEPHPDNLVMRVQSEQPRVLDRRGVLVVETEAPADFRQIVSDEREARLAELIVWTCR